MNFIEISLLCETLSIEDFDNSFVKA